MKKYFNLQLFDNGGEGGSDHAGTLVASTSGLEGKFCPLQPGKCRE